jgi:hypothetical protein
VVLHSSTAQFLHRPYHFAMSVYFSAIKRDLAILEESRTTHLHDEFAKYHNSKEEHVLRNCVAKMLYLRGPINK